MAEGKYSILALDGGGVKGYSSLLILRTLMRLVAIAHNDWQEHSPDQSYIDYLLGGECHDRPSSELPVQASFRAAAAPVPQESVGTVPQESVGTKNVGYPWVLEDDDDPSDKYLPCHYFDYIAGTSTGGLSAIILGRLRKTVNEALATYITFGNQVFGRPRRFNEQNIPNILFYAPRSKYSTDDMEKTIKEIITGMDGNVGEPVFTSDHHQCKTMVVASSEQHGVIEHYLFRTYDHSGHELPYPILNPGPAHNIPIWQVARATSAAPTYFKAMKIEQRSFLDGGIGANNPSFIALREARRKMPNTNPYIFVSIGTGRTDGQGNVEPIPHRGLRRLERLLDIFKNYALNSERIHMNEMSFAADVGGFDYYRFNVATGMTDIELDNWKPSVGGRNTLQEIRRHTNHYLLNPDIIESLLNCAQRLLCLRELRRQTGDWTTFGEGWTDSARPPAVSIEE